MLFAPHPVSVQCSMGVCSSTRPQAAFLRYGGIMCQPGDGDFTHNLSPHVCNCMQSMVPRHSALRQKSRVERRACRAFLLVPTGVAMPPKRGRAAAEDETSQELRRTKSAVNEAMNEFLCPITWSLPVDPVMAEDGKVYERSAIEEWLKQQQKSPVTNLAMGTKLLPALQVKNMIRAMVTSGALTGDKVDAWKLKLEEEEEVAEMLRKAEAGDGAAMYDLGVLYVLGEKGLAKDEVKAFEWYKKSHEAGFASGTGGLGRCYLVGSGVPKCLVRASTLLSDAAGRGSKVACSRLGDAYANGLWGFPKDETMARRYYSMVASASIDDLTDAKIVEAATWLRDHPAA